MSVRSLPGPVGLLRVSALLGLVLLLALTGLSAPAHGAAPAGPGQDAEPHADRGRRGDTTPRPGERSPARDLARDLAHDMVRPEHRAGLLARPRLWSGRSITYHERIPAKWDWSLTRAIQHWNAAGSRITFVEVRDARRADLTISYGYTGGADGMATLGQQARNWVHLSPAYKRVDENDPLMRVWVGRLFAHELGHVLGFGHTRGCTLMTPVFVMGDGGCKVLSEDQPGSYYCRWIDKALLRRFIDWYGGRAARPPVLCLIEKLPPPLSDVTFTGGGTESPVRVTWDPVTGARPGTKVVVSTWRRPECAEPPSWASVERVGPAEGSWTEREYGQGEQCYQVRIENRYGAARPGVLERREQHAPVPEAPVVGGPTWNVHEGAWRFTWVARQGERLEVISADPGQCVTAYDPDVVDWPEPAGAGGWLVHADRPEACLSFFVVTDWGTVSPVTTVEASTPVPPAPELSLTWHPGSGTWRAAWTASSPTWSLVVMHGAPSACPATFDPAEGDWAYEVDPGVWEVSPWAAEECLAFAVETSYGRISPVTQHVVSVPAPTAAPVVGQPAPGPAGSGAATVTATAPDGAGSIRVEVVPGACPQAVPADAGWWDGDQDWEDETRWWLYPEPWDSTEPSCAHFAVFDGWDRHGPVVSRSFTAG